MSLGFVCVLFVSFTRAYAFFNYGCDNSVFKGLFTLLVAFCFSFWRFVISH